MNIAIVLIIIATIGSAYVYYFYDTTDTPLDIFNPEIPDTPFTPEPNTPEPTNPQPGEPYDGGPIIIQGDNQFTSTYGVVGGSGTPDDPYIIEGWDIDVTKCDTSTWPYIRVGIMIYDTTVSYVIRDCQVVNAETDAGIMLQMTSGRVEGCTIKNSYTGISLTDSLDITISENLVEACENGISGGSYSSSNIKLLDNTITGCTDVGIDFFNLYNSVATGNTVMDCFTGIHVDKSLDSTISHNVVQGSTYEGMDVSYSGWEKDNNTVIYNDVSYNGGSGITVYGSYCIISYNVVNGNGEMGIRVDYIGLTDITGGYNHLSSNEVSSNIGAGIYLGSGCTQNTLSDNICLMNNANNEFYYDGSPKSYDIEVWALPNSLENNTYGTIYIYSP
jgi:parallel beta-helix repeat protein